MDYTKSEMQAYTIAKMIEEDQVVIVGTGLPLVGAIMAKKMVQPSCTLIVESGLMDFNPTEVPRSVSDLRSMEAICARFTGKDKIIVLNDKALDLGLSLS